MEKFFKAVRRAYNKLPTWGKILLLNGGTAFLTLLGDDLKGGSFKPEAYGLIIISVGLNVLGHLLLNEKKQ